MEGNSFVAPGHLPLKWNHYRPPGQPPPGYQPQNKGYQPQNKASWMTAEIRAELQNRNRLQEVSKKTGNPKDCQAYQAQCEKVQNMIDNSKSSLGLGSGYTSGYGSHTGPNPNGLGFGAMPSEYQNPTHSQGMSFPNPRGAYHHNGTNYYNERDKRKFLSCGPCNRTFYNKQRLDEHLKEHVECPFPECKLSAHIKIVDQHINNQHMLVNFANLQIDDETWVAQRKKRFPTSQRAELRRAEQMEKLKRGERLGHNKKPFKKDKGKYNKTVKPFMQRECRNDKTNKGNQNEAAKNVSTVDAHDESKEERGKGKMKQKKGRKWEKPTPPPRAFIEVDLFDSDSEVKDGLPAFRGTKQFYESTGEVSYFGNKIVDIPVDDLDDEMEVLDDANINISDDEEWHTVIKDKDSASGTLILGGALGSLMGAYSDSEEESENILVPSQNNEKLETLPSNDVLSNPPQNLNKREDTDEKEQNLTNTAGKRKVRRQPRRPKGKKGPVAPKAFPFPKRRKTLLQKLLQPDIIHERNVILQCVRFIVKNNFFDDVVENSECGEVKDDTCEKVVCEQGMVEGGEVGHIKESKKIGETFGKSEVREERKGEKVEEEKRNVEEIMDESARSEAFVDVDTNSKTDVCVSDCVDSGKTTTKRNSSSCSIPEDDGGYESDKESVSKKLKHEEPPGDPEPVTCNGTDTVLKDDEREIDLPNENKS